MHKNVRYSYLYYACINRAYSKSIIDITCNWRSRISSARSLSSVLSWPIIERQLLEVDLTAAWRTNVFSAVSAGLYATHHCISKVLDSVVCPYKQVQGLTAPKAPPKDSAHWVRVEGKISRQPPKKRIWQTWFNEMPCSIMPRPQGCP